MYSKGLTLFHIANVVAIWYETAIYGSGSSKVHQGIIGIIWTARCGIQVCDTKLL
jgi:hypothetical protein